MKSKTSISLIFVFLLIYSLIHLKHLFLVFNPQKITPISLFYPLVISREHLQSLFVFGDEDKCFWHLVLAQKRINEAQILFDHSLLPYGRKQLLSAQKHQQIANSLISSNPHEYLKQKNKDILNQIEKLKP